MRNRVIDYIMANAGIFLLVFGFHKVERPLFFIVGLLTSTAVLFWRMPPR